MIHNIKIPIKQLNEATIRELQQKYPNADFYVDPHPEGKKNDKKEEDFWPIIALFDWEQEEDDDIVAPAINALTRSAIRTIYEFADILSKKLYELDQKKYALHLGEDSWKADRYFSVDNFLYARCCAVANGKDYFNEVLETPAQMPKDLTFEVLLYLAKTAYQQKTGKEFAYVPAFPIETYSNKEGWKN
ncbi:MAG: DUF4240 domain-containing protein [Bacteroidota bacterium]